MSVAYKVDKYLFKYEPLYVARADSPLFDERFIGFGMTRNTQVRKKRSLVCKCRFKDQRFQNGFPTLISKSHVCQLGSFKFGSDTHLKRFKN